ncbi:hypothetical protein C8R44DRAFT_730454 [Mycena epipterygia]|nr:hypothetical protein C8R44DRAFT_730454 [Mycena epipterygia]
MIIDTCWSWFILMPIVVSNKGSLVDSCQWAIGALFVLNIVLWVLYHCHHRHGDPGGGAFLSDSQLVALELMTWIAVVLTAGNRIVFPAKRCEVEIPNVQLKLSVPGHVPETWKQNLALA